MLSSEHQVPPLDPCCLRKSLNYVIQHPWTSHLDVFADRQHQTRRRLSRPQKTYPRCRCSGRRSSTWAASSTSRSSATTPSGRCTRSTKRRGTSAHPIGPKQNRARPPSLARFPLEARRSRREECRESWEEPMADCPDPDKPSATSSATRPSRRVCAQRPSCS